MNAGRGWFSALTVGCGRLEDSQPNDGKLLGMVGAAVYEAIASTLQ